MERHFMLTEILNEAADIIIYSAIIPLLVFIFRYSIYSPFGRTPEGVNTLLKKISQALLVIVIGTSLLFGAYIGREWVRLIVYTSVTLFFWVDVVQLVRIQKKYPFRRFDKKNRRK